LNDGYSDGKWLIFPDGEICAESTFEKGEIFPIRKYPLRFHPYRLIISRTGSKLTMASIRSPQQLGHTLRAARKQLGLTQPQLALAAGVGVRFIVDLEAGKPTVRLENVLRVMDALGGEIQLIGLPALATDTPHTGADHGA
jgi:HTH-type transcriptional regulator / antitoxin HipB